MKKWTVMLIPHDRGERQSFEVSALHAWSLVAVMTVLCFSSGFLYQRNQVALRQAEALQRQYGDLEETIGFQQAPGVSEEELAEMEGALRAEYQARDSAVTTELSRLYKLETEVRIITGLPPRGSGDPVLVDGRGGKGGAPAGPAQMPDYTDDALMRPPEVIYGLSRPSADLIVQEIDLRAESLRALLAAMEHRREQIAHIPSIWPTAEASRRISSKFGYRRDPFTNRVRRHSGVDLSAPYGTKILATAKGVVSYSAYDKYLGKLVKVDHENGMETWYAHMSKRLVKKGDAVERGDVLGKVGSTGRSTGAHIHYEVRVDGRVVDPRKYFGN